MNARESETRERISPVTQQMDEHVAATEIVKEQPRLAEADAENLEFLKFLQSLNGDPDGIEAASPHVGDDSVCASIDGMNALPTEPSTFDALQPQTLQLDLGLEGVEATVTVTPLAQCPVEPEPDCRYLQLQLHEPPPNALFKHNFLHKLHLLASSEQVTFVSWSLAQNEEEQQQLLQLDYIGLQDHLCGEHSIFHCLNVLEFTRKLLALGFERREEQQQLPELEQELEQKQRPQLFYYHANFQCNQPEKLLLLELQAKALPAQQTHAELPKLKRTKAAQDASLLSPTAVDKAPLHLARCRYHTLLSYNNDVRLLQQQEPSAEQLLPRRGRSSNCRAQQTQAQMLTPALAAKQVNPSDSVLHFGAGKIPEYAGFYGRVEQTLIGEFFAEYLPRYGSRTIGYKDIVVDASKANAFQQNLPIGIVFSDDEEDPQQEQPLAESRKCEETQSLDNCSSIPGDMELEQVMQELCGVVTDEQTEEDLQQQRMNNVTTPELRLQLKRKTKPTRKSAENAATADAELASEHDPDDDLLQAAAASATAKRSDEGKASDDQEQETDAKGAGKRRRYHLRNSKSKRAF